jgi:hypothetical protein
VKITNIQNMVTTRRVTTDKIPLVVGDIHGMRDDLIELLTTQAGFKMKEGKLTSEQYHLFAVGDLIDKGPKSIEVLDLGIDAVLGNHDWSALRKLSGREVQVSRANNGILDLMSLNHNKKIKYLNYFLNLPLQIIVNDQFLIVHGAMMNNDIDALHRNAHYSNIYGCPGKERDLNGLSLCNSDWRENYDLPYLCIYGHEMMKDVDVKGRTINIDTGASDGNMLTAFDPVNNVLFQKKTERPSSNQSSNRLFQDKRIG